jgi:hypothetical protein
MHGCDNSAAVGTIPKLTHTNQSPFINNAKNINPVSAFACENLVYSVYISHDFMIYFCAMHTTAICFVDWFMR